MLQLGYRNRDTLFSMFLLAECCPLLRRFSKALQNPRCCFSDIVGLRVHYLGRIRDLAESDPGNPREYVKYWASWNVISEAGIECDATLENLKAFHAAVAKPYLDGLRADIEAEMADADVIRYLMPYDPSAVMCKAALRSSAACTCAEACVCMADSDAERALRALSQHFMAAKPPLHKVTFGAGFPAPSPAPPLWDAEMGSNLLEEYPHVVKKIHQEGLETFAEVLREFSRGNNPSKFPATANVLEMGAVLPLTSASVERLFSKLRLVSTRLRDLSDDNLAQLLFLCVEGDWGPTGIPTDTMEAYLALWQSKPRRNVYATFDEYKGCRDAVMYWRSAELERNTRRDFSANVEQPEIIAEMKALKRRQDEALRRPDV